MGPWLCPAGTPSQYTPGRPLADWLQMEDPSSLIDKYGLVILQCFFAPLGVFLVLETLKDEWCVVIMAYDACLVFEI